MTIPKAGSYIPQLDALRSLSALGVLLFHLRPDLLPLGWVGIQIFFVLSGFLITRILLSHKNEDRYFRNFYTRRALRLFPAYYTYLAAACAIEILLRGIQGLSLLPWYLVYLQTVPILLSQFTAGIPMVGHTWTLAIEEQFYWLWPILVKFVSRRTVILVSCIVVFVGPCIRSLLLATSDNPFAQIGSIAVQSDSLALGAILGAWVDQGVSEARLQRLSRLCLIVGATSVVALVWLSGGVSPYASPKLWAPKPHNVLFLSAVGITAVGIIANALLAVPTRSTVLTWRPLVALGKISYGVYLFHPMAYELTNSVGIRLLGPKSLPIFLANGWQVCLVKISLTVVAATVSWKVLERPFLALRGSPIVPKAIQEVLPRG
jgi:peptidoglycan/LPS O-acetylase OafA/YrhL